MKIASSKDFIQRMQAIQWRKDKSLIALEDQLSFYHAYRLMIDFNSKAGLLQRLPLDDIQVGQEPWESLVHLYTIKNNQFDLAESMLKYNTAWLFGYTYDRGINRFIIPIGTHRIKSLILLTQLGIISGTTTLLAYDANNKSSVYTWLYDLSLDQFIHDPYIDYTNIITIEEKQYALQTNQSRWEAVGYYFALLEEVWTNNASLFNVLNQYDPIITFDHKTNAASSLTALQLYKESVITYHKWLPSYNQDQQEKMYSDFLLSLQNTQSLVYLKIIDCLSWMPKDNLIQNQQLNQDFQLPVPLKGFKNQYGKIVIYPEDGHILYSLHEAIQSKLLSEDAEVGVFICNRPHDISPHVPYKIPLTPLLNNYLYLQKFWFPDKVSPTNIKLPPDYFFVYIDSIKMNCRNIQHPYNFLQTQ